ncbi:MAG TPA: cell division protein ZapE, partial [Agitococcus sp.]|nr:cell division protein ZapE [Agitococcus sp.]
VVICFDEFFVTDITDAMLLKGLFEQLFARGVSLVATSNIVPDRLYENGLQRERFLPAITLVKDNCQVLNVDSGIDYRLRVLTHVELYHYPLGELAHKTLQKSFDELAHGTHVHHDSIIINDRDVMVKARTEDVLWCDYHELCEKPRSASDFIEIAREYHTVLLSNVPVMGEKNDDSTRRFINLIDELYDRQVKLIITAEASIDNIYNNGRLNFEIKRTRSRLQEMQSQEYLQLPHLP